MPYNKDVHRRRSIRLRGFDYSQPGAYFITVCTHQRALLFGDVVDGVMVLNGAGMMVDAVWRALPQQYAGVKLGEHVVMPNHFHGIVHIAPAPDDKIVGAQFIAPDNGAIHQGAINQGAINRAPTVGNIVRAFKARCTHVINQMNDTPGRPVWQRNYYEHIIRHEQAYTAIAEYIRHNPQRWCDDVYCAQ